MKRKDPKSHLTIMLVATAIWVVITVNKMNSDPNSAWVPGVCALLFFLDGVVDIFKLIKGEKEPVETKKNPYPKKKKKKK